MIFMDKQNQKDEERYAIAADGAEGSKSSRQALLFILLMGIVSLFSDMTHEGAASIMGAFLSLNGASAAAIGFVSGLGEMIGYSLRLISGVIADKTKKYWLLTIIGYVIDCTAIPLLALVPQGGWVIACLIIVVQRTGKALKKPAKDTLLSFAATQTGTGKSFAIQEFLDQIGAFLGPVILFAVLMLKKNASLYNAYTVGFAVLGIPALITVLLLLLARRKFPHPENFEAESGESAPFKLNKTFRLYIAATSLFAFGYLDFSLITMHTAYSGLISSETLPLIYSGAMAVDAFAALFFGWLYDRRGLRVLMLSTLIAAPFSVFIFGMHTRWALFAGVALWGVGMGAQESILKAAVSDIVPKQNRSSGFGVFQTAFGICWFAGSWLAGILYDISPMAMIIFSVAAQLAAVPVFMLADRAARAKV